MENMDKSILNIPNAITTLRLLLIPLFLINLALNINFALIIITLIILLDKVDGISARIYNQITKFGHIYDGFTDFVLVVSSYIAFYIVGLLELFWIIIFAVPSVVILAIKISYYQKSKELPQDTFGKIIMGISYVAAIAVLINFLYKFHILILIVVLVYVYTAFNLYGHLIKNNVKAA